MATSSERPLKIGEVARRAGVGIDTVRYYERHGLLPAPERRASGYRTYDALAVEQLRFIKRLQTLGLELKEIAELRRATVHLGADCARDAAKLEAALRRTEERIAALGQVRADLRRALARCARGECGIADEALRVLGKSPRSRR